MFKKQKTKTQVENLKKEFVSIMSHQMRTPLSAIKWNLEDLIENRKSQPLNAWQKEKIKEAYQSNERMINLVDDLLNLSQIDDGQVKLNFDKVDMSILIREIAQQNAIYAKANNVTLEVKVDSSTPCVKADRQKIIQVIDNLINNAIKYSKGRGQVGISSSASNGQVVFAVQDQGIGIPAKNKDRVFEKFFRAKNALSTQADGTGLGLYVVQRLIEAHGGKVWFISKISSGTTFYFSLPEFK